MKTRPTPPNMCLSTPDGLSDITNVALDPNGAGAFTLKNWNAVPVNGQQARDLDPTHIDEALGKWDHFRMWLTPDFALDLRKIGDDQYEAAIHLRGIPSFLVDRISLGAFKASVEEFLVNCKKITVSEIRKGRFNPPN